LAVAVEKLEMVAKGSGLVKFRSLFKGGDFYRATQLCKNGLESPNSV